MSLFGRVGRLKQPPSKDLQLIVTALFLSFNLSPVAESLALCRFAHDSEPKDPQVVLDSFETSLFRSCAEKLHQVITETSACAVKAQAFGREGSHGFLVTQRCWDAPSFVKSFTHDGMSSLHGRSLERGAAFARHVTPSKGASRSGIGPIAGHETVCSVKPNGRTVNWSESRQGVNSRQQALPQEVLAIPQQPIAWGLVTLMTGRLVAAIDICSFALIHPGLQHGTVPSGVGTFAGARGCY